MKVIAAILITFTLTACGDDKGASVDSTDNSGAAAYKAKVDKKVSDSVVNSLVREWGISKKQAQCLLADLRASQLGRAGTDPAVQAVFDKCGVDPSVADS